MDADAISCRQRSAPLEQRGGIRVGAGWLAWQLVASRRDGQGLHATIAGKATGVDGSVAPLCADGRHRTDRRTPMPPHR
jgi:hypothetical protein